MLGEGQEFLRSKRGLHNTYNQGDAVNALNWRDRERPLADECWRYYAGLIRLRQSAEGAALRIRGPAPDGYYRWIEPAEQRALGYVVNPDRGRPGACLVVLLNAADRPVEFDVAFPAGRWRLVADGRRADAAGIPGVSIPPETNGVRRITLPPVSACIFLEQPAS
jgi:pullulanase